MPRKPQPVLILNFGNHSFSGGGSGPRKTAGSVLKIAERIGSSISAVYLKGIAFVTYACGLGDAVFFPVQRLNRLPAEKARYWQGFVICLGI